MDSRFKRLRFNTFLSLGYQAIIMISGFILPKLFLNFYGSAVNGLVSSITQFLAFINICDMGIGAVVSSAYYKPLAEKNYSLINGIFAYSKVFFNKIGLILCAYVLFLVLFYHRISNNSFSWMFTATLIFVMSVSYFAQYFLGISHQILLNADQKAYVQLWINGGTLLLNTIACIVIMYLGGSIHIVRFSTSIIYLLRPVCMYIYVKKNYTFIKKTRTVSNVIPQKKSGIIQHFAYMIYENTDIMVLTLFSTLESVSVYSVYVLVTIAIKGIIVASTNGFLPLFGNLIAKREQKLLDETYGFYEWLIHTCTTVFYCITGILIVPFVLIYTKGVSDVSYKEPLFAILIIIAYALNCIRNSMYTVIKAAGHYRQTQVASLSEALINLIVSIVFVFKLGLVGVAIGTIAATLFYTIYEVVYLDKNILYWPIKRVVKRVIIDVIEIVGIVILTSFVKNECQTIINWLVYAVIVGVISLVYTVLIQFIVEPGMMKKILRKIIKH